MKQRWLKIITISLIVMVLCIINSAWAIDLEDGISKYKDQPISADDKIGDNADTNINFIIVDAISKAKMAKKRGDENVNISDGSDENYKNSIICKPGSDCSGTIINIDLK